MVINSNICKKFCAIGRFCLFYFSNFSLIPCLLLLPLHLLSSPLLTTLGSHFNAGDSSISTPSGFLDDSRLSTSTWADPISASSIANGAANQNAVSTSRSSMTSSASFTVASTQHQQQLQNQMSASAGPQMMSTSMSFTLPNSSKNFPKSSSSHTLAGMYCECVHRDRRMGKIFVFMDRLFNNLDKLSSWIVGWINERFLTNDALFFRLQVR